MIRLAILLLVAALAACGSPAPEAPYRVVGRHGPLVYLVMGEKTPRDAGAWRAAALAVCGDARICNVKIWTDPARATRGFPLTDREAAGIEAAYLVNRGTGTDDFICQPFGSPKDRCR